MGIPASELTAGVDSLRDRLDFDAFFPTKRLGRARMRPVKDASAVILGPFVPGRRRARRHGPDGRMARIQRPYGSRLRPCRHQPVCLSRSSPRVVAGTAPRSVPRQTLASRDVPGGRREDSAPVLPRRVHLPVQPTKLSSARTAVLPAHPAGCGSAYTPTAQLYKSTGRGPPRADCT
jgi:hypothetical protein